MRQKRSSLIIIEYFVLLFGETIFIALIPVFSLSRSLFVSLYLNFICVIAGAYGAETRIKLTGASSGATSLSSDVVRGKCSIRTWKNRAALELRKRIYAREKIRVTEVKPESSAKVERFFER